MAEVTLSVEETRDHVVLIWRGRGPDVVGRALPNRAGFTRPHTTRVVRGTVRFRMRDRRTFTLTAGQEFEIPTGVPYLAEGVAEPIEVRCFYPKSDPAAVAEIEHLRREFTTSETSILERTEPTADDTVLRSSAELKTRR